MKSKKLTIKVIEKYKAYLYNEEKSQATIEKYIRDVYHFYSFLQGNDVISKDSVIQYKTYLLDHYKPASMNSMLVAINGLLSYMELEECKVKLYKLQRKNFIDQKMQLTKEEYEKLLTAAERIENEKLMLIIETICSTGIRVSEHKHITFEAIQTGIVSINNKGKIREILIPKKLRKVLLAYCKRNKIESGSIFVTRNGKPINRSNIWSMMKGLCDVAGVNQKKVFPHNLRHLFAVTFYQIEKDLVHLADMLGHTSIETTRIYTKTSVETYQHTLEKMGLVRYLRNSY